MHIQAEEAFFDPDTGAIGVPEFGLVRIGAGEFRMQSRIGYKHPQYAEPFVVPGHDQMGTFTTDLTSVPGPFQWLVPVVGAHLPAAIIHDGLIGEGEKQHEGPNVNREQADDLFRDAMRLSGTRRLRRWLVWTGVSLGTMWDYGRHRFFWRTMIVIYFVVLAGIGLIASLDVIDAPWAWAQLPWMGDRPWYVEVATGAVAAVIIPSVLSLTWGSRRTVGRVAGIALALLLHPTLLVGAVTVIYLIAEKFFSRDETYGPKM